MNSSAYITRKSFVHNLNPSLKILAFIVFIAMIFLPLGFFAQAILGIFLVGAFFLAKLPKKMMWNIIKSVIILFILLLLINWAVYKTPIAVHLPDYIHLRMGSFDLISKASPYLASPEQAIANQTYVSQIWGGINPSPINIDGLTYNFNNQQYHFTISEIISQNKAAESAKSFFDSLSNSLKTDFLKLAGGNRVLAEQYSWVVNNSFELTTNLGVNLGKFQSITVANADWNLPDQAYFFQTKWYTFSPKAIELALFISFKVFLIIVLSTLLTATTTSIELTYALEDLLSPLRILRLPVNEASMMIAIALRFIPSLLSESKRIMNAQASRGVDFKNGNLVDKTKSLVSLVVPLFSIAFKKAEELANAMDARAYNPRYARTRFRVFNLKFYDWLAFFILSLTFGILIGFTIVHIIFTPFGLFEAAVMYS